MAQILTEELIEQGLSFEAFRDRTATLYEEGLPTSGDPNSEIPLVAFTKVNLKRMDRLEKTIELDHTVTEKLLDISEPLYWVVLAEGWCGDVAQNLPIIHKMAEVTKNVELKILWRDQHLEVMDQYLTNGGRSIPKLIALTQDDLRELGTWGPRPAAVQEMILEFKQANEGKSKKEMVDELHEKMHSWYARDKGKTIQEEFITLLENWNVALTENA